MLVHQWGRQRQRGVIDRVALSSLLLDQSSDADDVPGNHRVVQHAQAAKRAELIVEATAPQLALFAEEQEARKVVRSLAFVQFPSLAPSVFLLVDRAQDVDGAIHAADLIERLVHA